MITPLTRRRFIGISAAAAGLCLLPFGREAMAEAQLVTWQGVVMGANASLQIHHHDRAAAELLIARSVAEVRHLEEVFSLYRDDSALSLLNAQGMLVAPPPELVMLLNQCRRYTALTGGSFDPTVQPLWSLYREHFMMPGSDPTGPSQDKLEAALAKVGFTYVTFDKNRIVFTRPGMGLTLNGIAQGYATDRVVEILRDAGLTSSLVDMGEGRALGAKSNGMPWRIGVVDPDHPSTIDETLEVTDRAVATSGAYGFRFDPAGRFNHLLDPRTGASAHRYRSVTAIMPDATTADALSTAFSLLSEEKIAEILKMLTVGEVHLVMADRERRRISA